MATNCENIECEHHDAERVGPGGLCSECEASAMLAELSELVGALPDGEKKQRLGEALEAMTTVLAPALDNLWWDKECAAKRSARKPVSVYEMAQVIAGVKAVAS